MGPMLPTPASFAPQYLSAGTIPGGRGLSPAIWTPVAKSMLDGTGNPPLYDFWDDFTDLAEVSATGQAGRWYAFIDTTGTWTAYGTSTTGDCGGVGKLTITADTDKAGILTPLKSGGGIRINKSPFASTANTTVTPTQAPIVAFECRFKLAAITANVQSLFIGLGEEGLATTNGLITTGEALADKDLVGFSMLDQGSALEFSYKKSGTTAVSTSGLKTMVADTWTKVGFIYNPDFNGLYSLKVYVDGTQVVAGSVLRSIIDNALNAAGSTVTFPTGEMLTPYLGIQTKSTTDVTVYFDWVRAYMGG